MVRISRFHMIVLVAVCMGGGVGLWPGGCGSVPPPFAAASPSPAAVAETDAAAPAPADEARVGTFVQYYRTVQPSPSLPEKPPTTKQKRMRPQPAPDRPSPHAAAEAESAFVAAQFAKPSARMSLGLKPGGRTVAVLPYARQAGLVVYVFNEYEGRGQETVGYFASPTRFVRQSNNQLIRMHGAAPYGVRLTGTPADERLVRAAVGVWQPTFTFYAVFKPQTLSRIYRTVYREARARGLTPSLIRHADLRWEAGQFIVQALSESR